MEDTEKKKRLEINCGGVLVSQRSVEPAKKKKKIILISILALQKVF